MRNDGTRRPQGATEYLLAWLTLALMAGWFGLLVVWPLMTLVWSLVAIASLISVLAFLAWVDDGAERSLRDHVRGLMSRRNGEVGFALLLRSSEADRQMSPGRVWPLVGWHSPGIEDGTSHLPEEMQFRRHLAARLAPLYIKAAKNDRDHEVVIGVDYGERWQAEIVDDFRQARLILLVPLWPSPAVSWEVRTLSGLRLLGKVFIVMPPALSFDTPRWPVGQGEGMKLYWQKYQDSAWSYEALRTHWNLGAEALKTNGLEVPRWPSLDLTSAHASVWSAGALLAQSKSGSGVFDELLPWATLDRDALLDRARAGSPGGREFSARAEKPQPLRTRVGK